jgi:transposase
MDGRVTLKAEDRETLERWIRSPASQQRLVRRSRIVLHLADGLSISMAASREGLTRRTVALWGQRFRDGGPPALLQDKPGRGRPKGRRPDVVARIVAASRTTPVDRARWSARALAAHLGVSHSTVLRVWREHGQAQGSDDDPPVPIPGRAAPGSNALTGGAAEIRTQVH